MTDGDAPLLLPEEYWLATTGAQTLPGPGPGIRLGMAIAALRELELTDDVIWDGRGAALLLHVGDPRDLEQPQRGWLELLVDYAGADRSLPARFVLDPLIEEPLWEQTAARLVASGLALCHHNRFTDDLYAVADVPTVRGWRQDVLDALDAGLDPGPEACDVLMIAHTSRTLPELLRGPGIELPAAVLSAAGAAVRRDAAAAHRYRETVTYRDAGGWAYGPAMRAGFRR